jgi:general secretion pathway protein M
MNASRANDRYLTRYPGISGAVYIAFVLTLLLTTVLVLTDIAARYRAVEASTEIFARLKRPTPFSSSESSWSGQSVPPGSPFLEGQTVTVASAALLERLTTAVARAGGNVVSSEVEPQGAQSKDGYVKVIATGELDQDQLQQLLYDIEAGMPFLFIEQFVVQSPLPSNDGGRMRVLLGVSGLWPGPN